MGVNPHRAKILQENLAFAGETKCRRAILSANIFQADGLVGIITLLVRESLRTS
jgi:hypothetical protein